MVLRRADVNLTDGSGGLAENEVERVIAIMQNPHQYKIQHWFLSREEGTNGNKAQPGQANGLDNKFWEDPD